MYDMIESARLTKLTDIPTALDPKNSPHFFQLEGFASYITPKSAERSILSCRISKENRAMNTIEQNLVENHEDLNKLTCHYRAMLYHGRNEWTEICDLSCDEKRFKIKKAIPHILVYTRC